MSVSPRHRQDIFSLAGWLFADLLLVLSLVFLVAAQPWRPAPTPVVTATPQPLAICGVAKRWQTVYVRSTDPGGLIAANSSSLSSFQSTLLHSDLSENRTHIAGLVEVFGGGSVDNGTQLAQGAIKAMQGMAHSGFIFTNETVYFRALWNGHLASDTLEVDVFYLVQAQKCSA